MVRWPLIFIFCRYGSDTYDRHEAVIIVDLTEGWLSYDMADILTFDEQVI